jgi:hypothetical protein
MVQLIRHLKKLSVKDQYNILPDSRALAARA